MDKAVDIIEDKQQKDSTGKNTDDLHIKKCVQYYEQKSMWLLRKKCNLYEFCIDQNSTLLSFGTPAITSIDRNISSPFKSETTKDKLQEIVFTSTSDHGTKTVQFSSSDDGILMMLRKDAVIYFYGLLLITVLKGEIEIFGSIINKNSKSIKVVSLRTGSLQYVKNVTIVDCNPGLFQHQNLDENQLSKDCAVIICKKVIDYQVAFIEKHICQQILPKDDTSIFPRVIFDPKGCWNFLKPHTNWDRIIETLKNSSKIMVCGGKGVGKSTFLRYAINRLLSKFKKVRFIDLDPGQSEFTIPGCISIVEIDKPIFEDNCTNLKTPKRSILSNIDISFEPKIYLTNVQSLINVKLRKIPTLINFMGFIQGIGINILSSVIVMLYPTDIVQIVSENVEKNYKEELNLNNVIRNARLFNCLANKNSLIYKLHKLKSLSDRRDGWTVQPRQLREMSVLGYLGQIIKSDSVFSSKLPLYKISLANINIIDIFGNVLTTSSINAKLVALCVLTNDIIVSYQCLGWAIVKGIDMNSNTLILTSSEEYHILENATHLVLNQVLLPSSIYMTPDDVSGNVPFTSNGNLSFFGQIPKRSRISIKKKIRPENCKKK